MSVLDFNKLIVSSIGWRDRVHRPTDIDKFKKYRETNGAT